MPACCSQAHIECTLTIEEETKETCRQTLEGDVDIKIFGLGGIAEHIFADNLKKVYSGIPLIVERCVYILLQPFSGAKRGIIAQLSFDTREQDVL